tara:strand:+ start:965 stop:2032 length:1068 start_codon:yes stop_codon:yes gene_type:complete
MALPKNYKGLEATKLHQKDFLPKYKELKSELTKKHPDLSSQKIHRKIYSKLGYPHWDTKTLAAGKPGAEGFEPFLINQGKPRVAGTRQTSNSNASAKRDVFYESSNKHISAEKQSEWTRLQKKFNSKGLQLDHINEIQETGPALETLDKWKKKGFISDAEYKKDKKLILQAAGNDPDTNAQGLTPKENSHKRTQVTKKTEALKKLEQRKLSNRLQVGPFKGKSFAQIFGFSKNGNGSNGSNGGLKVNGGNTATMTATNSPMNLVQKAAGLAQYGMRNLSLLNMVSEAITKKKATDHLTESAQRGYYNYMTSVNNPEQRAMDIASQNEKLKAKKDFFESTRNNVMKAKNNTPLTTL